MPSLEFVKPHNIQQAQHNMHLYYQQIIHLTLAVCFSRSLVLDTVSWDSSLLRSPRVSLTASVFARVFWYSRHLASPFRWYHFSYVAFDSTIPWIWICLSIGPHIDVGNETQHEVCVLFRFVSWVQSIGVLRAVPTMPDSQRYDHWHCGSPFDWRIYICALLGPVLCISV